MNTKGHSISCGKRRSSFYTMIELMVAMSVLVMMMGFLFQFVIGAQKIWSASSAKANVFQQAQIVFHLVEKDLQNCLWSKTPMREIPIYLDASSTDTRLGLVTTAVSASADKSYKDAGICPVLYDFDSNNTLLRRIVLDNTTTINSAANSFYGTDLGNNTFFADWIGNNTGSSGQREKSKWTLLRNVVQFRVQFLPNTLATERPQAAKITLVLFDPLGLPPNYADMLPSNKAQAREDCSRTFTKIIFLQ